MKKRITADDIPRLRKNTLIPLGTRTAGEEIEEISKLDPKFAELTTQEQLDLLNKATKEVADMMNKAGKTDFMMDTTTFNALFEQQKRENERNYRHTWELWQKTLADIENAKDTLPQTEKLRLQKLSVQLSDRIGEFATWFVQNNVRSPKVTGQAEHASKTQSQQKGQVTVTTLKEKCIAECKRRKLPQKETLNRQTKYEIAITIGMKVPAFKLFKSGNPAYQLVSKMLSEAHYSRKLPSKFDK